MGLAVYASVAAGAVVGITLRDAGLPGGAGSVHVEVATADSQAVADQLADQLRQWCAGTRRDFDLPLAWPQVGPFAADIYRALMAVAYATTVTYGELAQRAGHPRAARAVGRAMATNPWPLVVPCHRVVPAAGGIGNYGPGPNLKARLLGFEAAVAGGQAAS